MLAKLIGKQCGKGDGGNRRAAKLRVRQDSQAAVMVQNAANQLVGQVPAVGQAGPGQRMVPRESIVLKLAQSLGHGLAGLDEFEIRLHQVVGQNGKQVILQECSGEGDVGVRLQKDRNRPGEKRLLQAGIPEGLLVDQLRFGACMAAWAPVAITSMRNWRRPKSDKA